jgi:capsular polysaccharide export protein
MTDLARALLPLPPFPGATPHAIMRTGKAAQTEQTTPQELIAAIRKHRVGGHFWGDEDVWTASDTRLSGEGDDPRLLIGALAGKAVSVRSAGAFQPLDGLVPGTPEHEALLAKLVSDQLLDGLVYIDPFSGASSNPLAIVEILGGWRRIIEANQPIAAAFGFAQWKRDTVDPLLWGGHPVPFRPATMAELDDLPSQAIVAVWKARTPATFLERLEAGPWQIMEVEDGFIRSAGLGADCVPPLSIVVDDLGVHYDPSRPNRLEEMLEDHDFTPDELSRAARLRNWLVQEGVSKYGIGGTLPVARAGGDKQHLLVVGQVEDDRSVQFGSADVRSNLELLQRVRAQAPDAWIVYRPHPDVEAGHRRGAIPQRAALELADAIDPGSPISALIAMADEVHVMTSLAGFEALLHGKAVTTHGLPFFAGWGLTRDLAAPSPRRSRTRSVDELVAAVLLTYPRYLDPVTNLPCTAEILVMRLIAGVHRQNDALVPLRRLVGWARRASAQILGLR